MGGKRTQQARRRPPPSSSAPTSQAPPARSKDRPKDSRSKFGHDYSKDYADKSWPYHYGGMDRGAKIIFIVFPLIVVSVIAYVWYMSHLKSLVHTPLDAPKVIPANVTASNMDRFWGTYRSNLYLGFKTRSPHSPVTGLMWLTQFTEDMPPPIRHWCEHSDSLPMYGWFAHDGLKFGVQEALDKYYSLTMDFVKRPGGQHGGDWSTRITTKPRPGAEEVVVSLFFYIALDGQGSLQPVMKNNKLSSVIGRTEELGDFELIFPHPSKAAKINYMTTYAPDLSQLKESMIKGLRLSTWDKSKNLQYISLGGTLMPQEAANLKPNFIVYQVTATGLPFELQVQFESGSFLDRPDHLVGNVYQTEIVQHLSAFDVKFESTFKLRAKGYADDHVSFAKAAFSNMIGSIGYFYGSSLVTSKYITDKEPRNYWKAPLFTAVPSRSFFPRGFLWDEGFHNLLLSKWDPRLSMDIIGHWMDLINTEGWIPREQILGTEARAKVPSEFLVQHNKNANPPTFFLPLQGIVKGLIISDLPSDREYLQRLYPRLKAWYNWFNTTQVGPVPFSYRWRGRDPDSKTELNPKTLTSGLDDYPRASHPTNKERHLDLRCWMGLASGVMADISRSLGEPWEDYAATQESLADNKLLDELHWSEKTQRYSDYGLHTDKIKLERPKPKPTSPGQRQPPQNPDKIRVVKQDPEYQLVDSHFGYASLFPFLLKIIEPTSLKLGSTLNSLQDPSLLWTKYGLRSLAKSSPLYRKHNTEHDPPYWRGAIWININYLTIGALHHYSEVAGPYQEQAQTLYAELRKNIVDNLYNQYRNTGYIWEQYDDNTGEGKGTHPFTGWSALVVAIMAEQY